MFPAGKDRLLAVALRDDHLSINTTGYYPSFTAMFKSDGKQLFAYRHWKSDFVYLDDDGDGLTDKKMFSKPTTRVFVMQEPVWIPNENRSSQTEPNQAPEPTPTTVTPPAGQEARQP